VERSWGKKRQYSVEENSFTIREKKRKKLSWDRTFTTIQREGETL